MNKPGKKDLQEIRKYFEAPGKPQRKQEFLEKMSHMPLQAPRRDCRFNCVLSKIGM